MKNYSIITSIFFSIVFSQGVDYAGPNDPAGDIEAEREGYMNGNRVIYIIEIQQNFQIGQNRMYQNGPIILKVQKC